MLMCSDQAQQPMMEQVGSWQSMLELAAQSGWMGDIEGSWETLGLWEKGQPLLVRFHRIVPDSNLLALETLGRTRQSSGKTQRRSQSEALCGEALNSKSWGLLGSWGTAGPKLPSPGPTSLTESHWEARDSHDPRSTICHTSSHQ